MKFLGECSECEQQMISFSAEDCGTINADETMRLVSNFSLSFSYVNVAHSCFNPQNNVVMAELRLDPSNLEFYWTIFQDVSVRPSFVGISSLNFITKMRYIVNGLCNYKDSLNGLPPTSDTAKIGESKKLTVSADTGGVYGRVKSLGSTSTHSFYKAITSNNT